MLAIAVIIAILASVLGVYLSFFIDSAPAPTIVLLMTVGFISAVVVAVRKAARGEVREAA
jgi:manganese/iron transport system permease protein